MNDLDRWRIVVTSRAGRQLKNLQPRERERIRASVDALASRPREVDVRKVRGKSDEWRLRTGVWRVRFKWEFGARTIILLGVDHRSEAYRR